MTDWYQAFVSACAHSDWLDQQHAEAELPDDEPAEETEIPPSAADRLKVTHPHLFRSSAS